MYNILYLLCILIHLRVDNYFAFTFVKRYNFSYFEPDIIENYNFPNLEIICIMIALFFNLFIYVKNIHVQ